MRPRHVLPLAGLNRRRLAPGLALLLACALLWGQWLGQMHRALHLPGMHAHATAHAHAAEAAHDLLSHLLAPADDPVDCRLYDQLGQDWTTTLPLLALPAALLPQLQGWAPRTWALPAVCAPFAARAPPLPR